MGLRIIALINNSDYNVIKGYLKGAHTLKFFSILSLFLELWVYFVHTRVLVFGFYSPCI